MSYAEKLKQAKKNDTIEKVESVLFKFEKKGDTLIGKLIGFKVVNSKEHEKPFVLYTFDTDNGVVKCTLGAMVDGDVAINDNIDKTFAIEFLGVEPLSKNRKANQFDILTF